MLSDWVEENMPEWHVIFEDNCWQITRYNKINGIRHKINESSIFIDSRYPSTTIEVFQLNVADPQFFEKLEIVLKNCERIFNY